MNFKKAIDYCENVFDGTHETPKYVDVGYKFLTSKNIMDGYLDKENAFLISQEDYDSFNIRSQVHKWDVLFSMIGSVGNVCLIQDDNIDFAVKNMGVFSCRNEYKAKWLYYYFKSPYAKKLITNQLHGAVQKFLGLEKLREFPILEYSDDKKPIVDLLSNIDDKIALNNKTNTELENMAKTIYDYWFTQFDFLDKNGHPYKTSGGQMVYNETLKREIPAGWEVKRLGDLFTTNRGVSYNTKSITAENGIPMINLASFTPTGEYNLNGIKTYSGDFAEEKKLKPYDLVMCNTQQTAIDFSKDIIGKVLLVPDIFDGDIVSSHHVNTIKFFNENLKLYFFRFFNTDFFHKYISNFANGTSILGLIFSGVEDYMAVIPPDSVLHEFNKLMFDIEKKKNLIIKENMNLTKLRDYLLPLLMNGQIEVK